MNVALYAMNAALLERWRQALAANDQYRVRSINLAALESLGQADVALLHWEDLTAEQRERIQRQELNCQLVVLADTPNFAEGRQLILNGIRGYANSYIHASLLPAVVSEVAAGNIWAVPELLQVILKGFLDRRNPVALNYDLSELSERENQVFDRLIQGESNREIAAGLNITERTVKAHVGSILKKTGAPDRVHLIVHGTS